MTHTPARADKYTLGHAVVYNGSIEAERGKTWYYAGRCRCPDCHDMGVLDPGRIRYKLARRPLAKDSRWGSDRNEIMRCVRAASFDMPPRE